MYEDSLFLGPQHNRVKFKLKVDKDLIAVLTASITSVSRQRGLRHYSRAGIIAYKIYYCAVGTKNNVESTYSFIS